MRKKPYQPRNEFRVPILEHLLYGRKVQGLMAVLKAFNLIIRDRSGGHFDIVPK